MKGTGLVYKPGVAEPSVVEFAAPPTLEFLQGAVGGYIEQVPQFDNIRLGERIERCVAFCNETGKLDGLPFNAAATEAWEQALPTGLRDKAGQWLDFLVGPIIVVAGDAEFMAEL